MFVTVYSYANERVLHEVDLAGDSVTQSFGHGYLDEDEFIRGQLSDATIACVDDPLRILFAFKEHPILRAHRPGEDDPVWTAALEDYAQSLYAYGPSSPLRMVSGHGELIGKPHALAGRHIVWQTYYQRLVSARIRTYLIDAVTGQGALISENFPQLLEMTPERFVAVWNDPYPRIEVRELVGN